jgi:hypothetical protein
MPTFNPVTASRLLSNTLGLNGGNASTMSGLLARSGGFSSLKNNFSGSIGNPIGDAIQRNISGVFTGIGMMGIGKGAMSGISNAGEMAGGIESQLMGLTTLLKDPKKARLALKGMEEDALSTPYDLLNIVKANRFLMGPNKGDINKTRADVMGLGNAISAEGGGNDEFIRMAYNMKQIANQGKAMGLDMRQFSMAGIDIYGLLSEAYGKSTKELKEYNITFEMINTAFRVAMQEGGRYFKGFENAMTTAEGKRQRFNETIDLLKIQLGGVYNDFLKPIYDLSNVMFGQLRGFMESGAGKAVMGSVIGLAGATAMTLILGGLVTLLIALGPALALILPVIVPMAAAFLRLGQGLANASTGMSNITNWLDDKSVGLKNNRENRLGAKMRAYSEAFNSYDSSKGTFSLSSGTLQAFAKLGMGTSDIEKTVVSFNRLKDTVRGIFDGFSEGVKSINNYLTGDSIVSKMVSSIFGLDGNKDAYGAGLAFANTAKSVMVLGVALAVAFSPMLKFMLIFMAVEKVLDALGLKLNPMIDAMSVGFAMLAWRINPVLGLLVTMYVTIQKLKESFQWFRYGMEDIADASNMLSGKLSMSDFVKMEKLRGIADNPGYNPSIRSEASRALDNIRTMPAGLNSSVGEFISQQPSFGSDFQNDTIINIIMDGEAIHQRVIKKANKRQQEESDAN